MAIFGSRPRKGLADVRTLSGRVDQDHLTYRTYFKLGALEMQRLRKQKEKDAALYRITDINESLSLINNELASLHGRVKCGIQNSNKSDTDNDKKMSQGILLRY